MLVLRVRCVDDGCELLLERHGAGAHSIHVAELKRLVLQQRHRPSAPPPSLEDCFVLLQGQILADPDIVDLNALAPSDFFVFVSDISSAGIDSSFRSEMHKGDIDPETVDLLQSQLVEMGFSTDLAVQALRQSGYNLSHAASLLAEGTVFGSGALVFDETTTDLVAQHPAIAPLQSLVHDENVKRLRQVAAMDSLQASLLLREHFSSDLLNQLNENAVATLQLLLLPSPPSPASLMNDEIKSCSKDVIDVDDKTGVNAATCSSSSDDAIDRLTAMGFDRDLVVVLYESCGKDEQLTANALLQTFES